MYVIECFFNRTNPSVDARWQSSTLINSRVTVQENVEVSE